MISYTFHTVLEGAVTLTLIGNFLAKQASAKCYSLPIHMPEAPKHGAFMDIPRTPPSKWLSNLTILCTAQMQCMTADCQTHDIIMMYITMCMYSFGPSATIVPVLWLSANSTQKFNDLLLDHG